MIEVQDCYANVFLILRMNPVARLKKMRAAGLPWFMAVDEGVVRGYCYLSLYRVRCAYRFTPEDAVYIDATCQGRGIGKMLLSRAMLKPVAFASSWPW